MPTNKNAQLRYQILDRCFSDKHRRYTIDDLLQKVNEALIDLTGREVSLRQIRDDIKYMRDRMTYDAPIEAIAYEGKKCYYTYSDPTFSIFKNELTAEELEKLRSTIEMLGRYRGFPDNAWLEEVISNLEYRFGVKSNPQNLVLFGQNELLKGLENLSDLIDKTISHTPLALIYHTYSGTEIPMTLHPYFLKQYNGRWFLFGWNEQYNKVSNVALDRIVRYVASPIPFRANDQIEPSTYFEDIIGVTIPKEDVKKEAIVLRFSEKRYPYVLSKPLHHSQKATENCTVEINVRPTKELDQQIFSYIPDVEVVSPQWYRTHIQEKIEENLKKYMSMQNDCTDGSELCSVN
jgi:predicted DNA-binding transcriptional regulator YafY